MTSIMMYVAAFLSMVLGFTFVAGLAFVAWLVVRILIRNAYPPTKCPHCGKPIP